MDNIIRLQLLGEKSKLNIYDDCIKILSLSNEIKYEFPLEVIKNAYIQEETNSLVLTFQNRQPLSVTFSPQKKEIAIKVLAYFYEKCIDPLNNIKKNQIDLIIRAYKNIYEAGIISEEEYLSKEKYYVEYDQPSKQEAAKPTTSYEQDSYNSSNTTNNYSTVSQTQQNTLLPKKGGIFVFVLSIFAFYMDIIALVMFFASLSASAMRPAVSVISITSFVLAILACIISKTAVKGRNPGAKMAAKTKGLRIASIIIYAVLYIIRLIIR